MPNYEHKKIIETIMQLDAPPSEVQAFAEWIKGNAHLRSGRLRIRGIYVCTFAHRAERTPVASPQGRPLVLEL